MLTRKRSLLAAVLGAVVVLGPLSTGAAGDTTQLAPASPAVLVQLRTIVLSEVRSFGDPHPTHMRMVETNATAAWQLFAPEQQLSSLPPIPVYAVAAHGHFGGPFRPGNVPPAGKKRRPDTTLFLILDSGFSPVALGHSRLNPDLRKLGTVQKLAPAPHS